MATTSSVDLVIVGAGAAGIGAALTARQRGMSFLVLEASDRIGGRADTDQTAFGVPWDRGCHWLHSASINPFTELADRYRFRYRRQSTPWHTFLGDRWASESEASPLDAFVDRTIERAMAEGQAGHDVAVADLIDRSDPGVGLLEATFNAEWGSSLDQVSTIDVARYRDTHENWPVEDGYGALVARHAADLAVEVSTPVERIAWGSQGVRVTTPAGTVSAAVVILTVSTGVLTAELIAFDQPLPDWKQAAIDAVPLGHANKVAFKIDGRLLGVEDHTNVMAPLADGTLIGLQLRPFGRDLVSAYLGGTVCRELEAAGKAAMIDAALGMVKGLLGNDIAAHVEATACSRWASEPYIRGAYAAARPGDAHRRAELARPLADRLLLAGEATSPTFFSTCHGAYLTGVEAANTASMLLGES